MYSITIIGRFKIHSDSYIIAQLLVNSSKETWYFKNIIFFFWRKLLVFNHGKEVKRKGSEAISIKKNSLAAFLCPFFSNVCGDYFIQNNFFNGFSKWSTFFSFFHSLGQCVCVWGEGGGEQPPTVKSEDVGSTAHFSLV